ncbi:MAG: ABC transporter substrate-binding protein [Clostridiales bacterium]|nr:ABC transporter substrate-binding protein [Clostridiales bacterium]
MLRKLFVYIIIIIMFLSATGCSMSKILPEIQEDGNSSGLTHEPDLPVEPSLPIKGGQLRIPIIQPKEINPLFTESKDFMNFSGLIYEGLFAYDEDLNLIPGLAESWEVYDNGALWQLQLRKGVKWHDGTEFTARDVKYSFDLLFKEMEDNGGQGTISHYTRRLFAGRDIARVEFIVNNPYAIAIVLNKPTGRTLLEALTFPIIPFKEEAQDLDTEDISPMIGTGPYKVERWDLEVDNFIKLVRNDSWWGKPTPYIDTIIAQIYKDKEESLEAFKSGEVDLVDTHVIYAESYAAKGVARLYRYLTNNYIYIGINHANPGILGDPKIREAVAYSIDRKDIISRVYFGNAQAIDVPVPIDAWYYDPDSRVFDYQPAMAQKILQEAGWKDFDRDGILDKLDGAQKIDLRFTINAIMDNNIQKETLELIAEQLREIGIYMEIRLLPWEDYIEALETGNFEAVLATYTFGIPGATDLYSMLHSSGIGSGLDNYMGYSSATLDRLLEEVNLTKETEDFHNAYNKIQSHLVEKLPIISLYYETSSLITSQKLNGIKAPKELMIFRDVNKWYLSS